LHSPSFDLHGRVVAITGGVGVLGAEIGCALLERGAAVALLDIDPGRADRLHDRLEASGGRAMVAACDVLDRGSVEAALASVVDQLGPVDSLVNAAGGNHPSATTGPDKDFFSLPTDALRHVVDLNLLGTVVPSQVFARAMAEKGAGAILNISSMNALRPLTRIPAYSAAKAAVSNFTQWLAVHLAQEYSPRIRVNAIAPGFFLTDQNRFLLIDQESGDPTARGRTILEHTPMGRYGRPEDLLGAVVWLLSPAASFVTGVVVPVDGGFQAFSGV
jgi:NAD(P)-dependent dehydrogenase (short-subunit alcohol dehydrogenase family)